MAEPTLAEVHERAASHLAAIEKLFVPGMKLTLLVRQPAAPDGSQDFCLTNDDLAEAIAALGIRARESGLVDLAEAVSKALKYLKGGVSNER